VARDFLLQPLTQTSFALFKQKIAEPRKRKSLLGVNALEAMLAHRWSLFATPPKADLIQRVRPSSSGGPVATDHQLLLDRLGLSETEKDD
jgi:hypothetical protein